METKEFITAMENGIAKVLTLEAARKLRGKRIAWMYLGYKGNENIVQEMVVGPIVSELEYQETQPMEGWKSRADYWRSYMNSQQIQDKKERLALLDENGNNPFISAYTGKFNMYDVPTFTCSDADREVYYIEIE